MSKDSEWLSILGKGTFETEEDSLRGMMSDKTTKTAESRALHFRSPLRTLYLRFILRQCSNFVSGRMTGTDLSQPVIHSWTKASVLKILT